MKQVHLKIFISSVQKELPEERKAIKTFIDGDPLLRRFFTVFLFEDLPASDRRADSVYLAEVEQCAVYVGLFGREYGGQDKKGLSLTERKFASSRSNAGTRHEPAKPATKRPSADNGDIFLTDHLGDVHALSAKPQTRLVFFR